MESKLYEINPKLKEQKEISQDLGRKLFEKCHLRRIVQARGDVPADSLVREYAPRGFLRWEAAKMASALTSKVQKAFTRIESCYPSTTEPPATEFSELSERLGDIPTEDSNLYLEVARTIASERLVGDGFASNMLGERRTAAVTDDEYQNYEYSLEKEGKLAAQIDRLNVELNTLLGSLWWMTKLGGIRAALGALTFFAATGIAFPMVLMAWRPVPDTVWWRGVEVGVFLVGLLVLLGYFGWMIRNLRKESEENK
ncbi:MAG TPA: hypothetical protein VFO16_06745 [Pseudonocardiaceae bacterium]|nr:hypothetical protein [Pseudonocardiaceae bacterium]